VLSIDLIQPRFRVVAFRRYVQGFRGFERDARVFLVATLFSGAAISLFWIDFNLYLAALGFDRATIGLVAATGSLSGALMAFPASMVSDRIGRRLVMMGGIGLMAAALALLSVVDSLPLVFLLAAMYAAGQQSLFVVQIPFLSEHSRTDQRSELFSLQFALMQVTQVGAAVLGGVTATAIAAAVGIGPAEAGVFRIVLMIQTALLIAALLVMTRVQDDRRRASDGRTRTDPSRLGRLGIRVGDRRLFFRILLPGFLIALGAGQVIPFLNLYISGKFALDLSQINGVFALTGFGTVLAILIQPALARRFGKVRSVVIVQVASLPFLAVLGFSPILWMVIIAMAVRNSLMNAGNPILNAFAMEQVRPDERATMAAAMSVLWSVGWVISGPWYSLVQANLGFERGYTVAFITIILLYSVATTLYWWWFRDAEVQDARSLPSPAMGGEATKARP
jgi:MFS family permease